MLLFVQVKGSGLANTCPVIEGGSSNLKDIKPGNYQLQNLCLEPTSFTVKEEADKKGGEPEFVKTKLVTRLTYTLADVSDLPFVDTFQRSLSYSIDSIVPVYSVSVFITS